MDLITRRVIQDMEGTDKYPNLEVYADPESDQYQEMIRRICSQLKFTTLRYHRLDDMIESVGLDKRQALHLLLGWSRMKQKREPKALFFALLNSLWELRRFHLRHYF